MEKRMVEKYFIKNVSTERFRKSAIPTMKRMLNEEEFKIKKALKNAVSVPREHCFLKPISVKI